jgi:hypothetical protein
MDREFSPRSCYISQSVSVSSGLLARRVPSAGKTGHEAFSEPSPAPFYGVAIPNRVMRDKNCPYAFTLKQMGPYNVDSSNATEVT